DTAPALFGRGGRELGHEWVPLQEVPDRAAQLSGAESVNQPDAVELGHERFVEEFLRSRESFIDRAADHVQFREWPFAGLEIDVHPYARWLRRTRRGRGNHPQLVELGAQTFAADVHFGFAIVERLHSTFEPERTNQHPIANRRDAARIR